MAYHRFRHIDPHIIRHLNRDIVNLVLQMHEDESKLVTLLFEMNQQRYYTRFGYRTLRGYCVHALKFSRTQAQRIVTRVRRYEI